MYLYRLNCDEFFTYTGSKQLYSNKYPGGDGGERGGEGGP